MVANKVTHIINCAGKQIQNHWEPIGVAYLTFFWLDQDNQVCSIIQVSTAPESNPELSVFVSTSAFSRLSSSVCLVGLVGPERPER